ncbi:MAG: hypothetical protein WC028_31480 [Candidatus Obscuribacterales bacterium]|jgi:hypothetical protein
MSNNGFFSHYPFFTPPPESEQEPADLTFDAGATLRRLLDAMDLPKIDFTVDKATAPAWWDAETQTLNFRAPVAQSSLDPVSLRDCLIFPEGVICEGPSIR